MDKAFEMDQAKRAADIIMRHFEKYLVDCKEHWPRCPYHGSEMCQVMQKNTNTYFQCFEITDELKPCGHREWSI